MAEQRQSIHGLWSSRWAFILAATGSAVGLGNIWKFPYITGEYGGGAFVVVYLICIAMVGIPVMMAEVLLGRRGRRSPINTMRLLAAESGQSPAWQLVGWVGVLAGFIILSFYSVIAGWAMSYVLKAGTGTFAGGEAAQIGGIFSGLLASPLTLLSWHTLFMGMTIVVVARGVEQGLERAVRILMPALLVLLLILLGYAMNSGYFADGLAFLFQPDFSRLTGEAVLVALGHAFFTLSLGMGAIMVYGAYLPKQASIASTTITIAAADTLVALLAGMAIFPIVLANGLEPGSGPGLIFQTLPIAFGQMPGGTLFGTLFFVLLSFAAWTSAISLLEPAVAWLVESRGLSRVSATWGCGSIIWLLGLGTVVSFNIGADFTLFGRTVFDNLDFLASNIMLPLGGLLIAFFTAWRLPDAARQAELAMRADRHYALWLFMVRYIAPVGVGIIFLKAIGLL